MLRPRAGRPSSGAVIQERRAASARRATFGRCRFQARRPAGMGAGASSGSEGARLSRANADFRRREREAHRRMMHPKKYDTYTEPEYRRPPASPPPQISPKVAPSPEPAAPEPAAPTAPPGMVVIALQVPPGCQPGQVIAAQYNGQTLQVACPPGVPEGGTFQVQVPATPVAQAVV